MNEWKKEIISERMDEQNNERLNLNRCHYENCFVTDH